MRKITSLMFLLMWSFTFYAQTYLTQGFEGMITDWRTERPTQGATQAEADDWSFTPARANSGANSIFFSNFRNDNEQWLITPPMDLSSATSPELTYYENLNYSQKARVNHVKYSTDYNGTNFATATWTDINTTIGTDAEDIWKIRGAYTLPTSAVVSVAFRYEGNNSNAWYLDDILVREKPACVEPPSAIFTNITKTSATISWESGSSGGTETYDIELVDISAGGSPTGVPSPLTQGLTMKSFTSPAFIPLPSGNRYAVYIRANCGGTHTSAWSLPFVFATKTDYDNCTQARVVEQETGIATVNSATAITGSIDGATSSGVDAPICAVNSVANDDIWYSFVAKTDAVNITFDLNFDGVAVLYSGICGTINELYCENKTKSPTTGTPVPVEEIVATGLTVGDTYYVRIYYYYGRTIGINGDFTMKVWTPQTLSNEEFELSKFKYFPNPVNDNLYLESQGNIENVSIYNVLGQEVLRIAPNKISVKVVDISALKTGIYFARITIDGVTETKRVVKN